MCMEFLLIVAMVTLSQASVEGTDTNLYDSDSGSW